MWAGDDCSQEADNIKFAETLLWIYGAVMAAVTIALISYWGYRQVKKF